MSWFDDIRDADQWRESPFETAAKTIGCALAGPLCVAGEVRSAAEAAADRVSDAGEGLIDDLGENAREVLDGVAGAADRTAELMKWIAIGLYGLTALVIVLAVIWFFK